VVGEVGTETGLPLQGFRRIASQPKTSPPPLDPLGVAASFEAIAIVRSRYSVHGIPPRRFNGLAVFSGDHHPAPKRRKLP
jgi:hypothetical protein